MRPPRLTIRVIPVLVLAVSLSLGLATLGAAQSQEPKPVLPATPVAESDLPTDDDGTSGVSGSSWQGANWGVSVSWDPGVWTVEAEFADTGYDGLQIGTPRSTVYLEAYAGFAGDAAACFAGAAEEIATREGVTEVVPLSGRPLPAPDAVGGEAQLFGLTLTLPDGTIVRAVEYVECRTIVPDLAVFEITWQTATATFNQDFPNVEALLATIDVAEGSRLPATPVAPIATPIA